MSPNNGILFKGVLVPNLLCKPLASCSLKNLDLLHNSHFDKKSTALPLIILETLGFILCVFLYALKNMIT